MIRSYVNEIAAYLQEYGQLGNYELPVQFYQDLAWSGLTNYPAFASKPEAEKTRITNTIYAEQQGRISPNGTRPRGMNYCD